MAEDTDFLDGNAPEIGGQAPKPRPLVPIPGSGKPKPAPTVVPVQPAQASPSIANVTPKKQGMTEDASTVRRPFTPVPQRKAGATASGQPIQPSIPAAEPRQDPVQPAAMRPTVQVQTPRKPTPVATPSPVTASVPPPLPDITEQFDPLGDNPPIDELPSKPTVVNVAPISMPTSVEDPELTVEPPPVPSEAEIGDDEEIENEPDDEGDEPEDQINEPVKPKSKFPAWLVVIVVLGVIGGGVFISLPYLKSFASKQPPVESEASKVAEKLKDTPKVDKTAQSSKEPAQGEAIKPPKTTKPPKPAVAANTPVKAQPTQPTQLDQPTQPAQPVQPPDVTQSPDAQQPTAVPDLADMDNMVDEMVQPTQTQPDGPVDSAQPQEPQQAQVQTPPLEGDPSMPNPTTLTEVVVPLGRFVVSTSMPFTTTPATEGEMEQLGFFSDAGKEIVVANLKGDPEANFMDRVRTLSKQVAAAQGPDGVEGMVTGPSRLGNAKVPACIFSVSNPNAGDQNETNVTYMVVDSGEGMSLIFAVQAPQNYGVSKLITLSSMLE